MTSVYISVTISVTDPPPSYCKIVGLINWLRRELRNISMRRNIQRYLNWRWKQWMEEKLRLAEEKRSKRAEYVSPKVTEKSGGKAKKKSM